MVMQYMFLESPVGRLLLAGSGGALKVIAFPSGSGTRRPEADWIEEDAPFAEAAGQLREYFAGDRRRFDLPLTPEGTPFQLQVWEQLRLIPYGRTISYGELARRIGNPRASRAVGLANSRNPLPIVIPCHRVIGSDGRLTGFGGGLAIKQRLLDLERSTVAGPG